MKGKNLARWVTLGTVLLLVVLAVSFYWTNRRYRGSGQIVLPSGQGSVNVPGSQVGQNGVLLNGVSVDISNVQKVIATLHRPEEYYWEGETETKYVSASDQQIVHLSKRGALSRIELFSGDGASEKQVLLSGNQYYSWNSGSRNFYKGALGDVSADDVSRLPTYEAVLDLPAEEITEAGYLLRNGEACIYVKTKNPQIGSEDSFYISVSSGLLIEASSSLSGVEIYSMKQSLLAIRPIEDSVFVLPNGQSILG